jgi:hypothetical protein
MMEMVKMIMNDHLLDHDRMLLVEMIMNEHRLDHDRMLLVEMKEHHEFSNRDNHRVHLNLCKAFPLIV